jgi:F-type H+-transporting ATPase subunit delta
LTEALSWRTGKVLKPQFAVDAMLIGGVIARIGDTVYDGSVRSQLRELAAKLTFGRA